MNGFSKKIENHMTRLACISIHYNFCRIHKSRRVTPAMRAGPCVVARRSADDGRHYV